MSDRVIKNGKTFEPCVMCIHTFVEKGSPDYPYCGRTCFEDHLMCAVEPTDCKIRSEIIILRDDAERRVINIEGLGTNKLQSTKEYFQARADVLNDLLSVMDGEYSCSCETHYHPFQH